MKPAVEPLTKLTVYDKPEKENTNTDSSDSALDSHPNAIPLSMFDDNEERIIDDDYCIMEGYAQTSLRSHDRLLQAGDVNPSHIISARVANNDSLLSSDAGNVTSMSSPNVHEPAAVAETFFNDQTAEISFPTLLTFIEGSLVGDRYIDERIEEPEDQHDKKSDDDLFQDGIANAAQPVPTLSSVAEKISRQEGKTLDEKQYIAYEIIACSFLLSLIEDAEFNHSSTLHSWKLKRKTL